MKPFLSHAVACAILAASLLPQSNLQGSPSVANAPIRTTEAPDTPSAAYRLTNAFGNLAFRFPLAIASPPGETNRLFVVEQEGFVSVITNLAAPTRTVF